MLTDEFMAQGHSIHTATLDAVQGQVHGKTVILLDLEEPLLANITSAELKSLQHLAEVANLVVWVTSCGQVSEFAPEYAMVSGLSRCLTSENSSLDLVTLSFVSGTTPDDALAKIISNIVDHRSSDTNIKETEYFVDHGVIHVSRMVPGEQINEMAVSDAGRFQLLPIRAHSAFQGFSYGNRILFKDDCKASDALNEDHIGVQIQAIGFGSNVRLLTMTLDCYTDTD